MCQNGLSPQYQLDYTLWGYGISNRAAGDRVTEEAISEEVLLKRLNRIEGQVRGIQKMIKNSRDCEGIITKLAAVRSAIDSVGALVLNNCMKLCFSKGREGEHAGIDSLARAVAIWGKVHVGDKENQVTSSAFRSLLAGHPPGASGWRRCPLAPPERLGQPLQLPLGDIGLGTGHRSCTCFDLSPLGPREVRSPRVDSSGHIYRNPSRGHFSPATWLYPGIQILLPTPHST